MSQTTQTRHRDGRNRLQSIIGEHAQALDDTAATSDDPAAADACAILAAVARGEVPPESASRRAARRVEGASR